MEMVTPFFAEYSASTGKFLLHLKFSAKLLDCFKCKV